MELQPTKTIKNGFVHYTQYQKKTLKNGEIKYYKKRSSHKLKCVNLKEKNKLISQMKIKITHNPELTTEDIRTLLNIISFRPKEIKNYLNSTKINAIFRPCIT